MRRLAVALLLALALAGAAGAEEPRLSVAAGASAETVFRWETQRCAPMHVPDSPARAMRTGDGGVALLAAHLVNIPLLGRDFEHLSPACAASSRGAEAEDPALFQDRFWIQAVIPLTVRGERRVLGLASHEYMGWRHPGRCAVPGDGPLRAFRCWYSAITLVQADERDWRFRPVTAGAGGRGTVVAASPFPYDASAPSRTGFFSVTNAVVEEGHATVLAYTEGIRGQPRGNCVLRAPMEDLVGGWRALSGGAFALQLGDAYATNGGARGACDVVGASVLEGPVRSLLRVPAADGSWWMAVFTRAGPRGGVFYAVSRDLRQWSPARLLWSMVPFRGQPEAGTYYEYPSLIDHGSASPVFDRVAEDAGRARVHLYLTRLNLQDRRRGLDRDLVRLPISIAWAEQRG
ncbi:hypothetical protein [Muricoccus radiodurans]|uniref:hypothetical protein n=1 Tax=Muricoccus radiodurans TaxID=2231721 RepID=UPI003CEA75AF